MSDRRAESLRELMESAGWRIFREECVKQWGAAACFERLEREFAGLPKGDAVAQEDATAQMVAVKKAIESLIEWPKAEFMRLTNDAEKDNAPVPLVPRRAGGNR